MSMGALLSAEMMTTGRYLFRVGARIGRGFLRLMTCGGERMVGHSLVELQSDMVEKGFTDDDNTRRSIATFLVLRPAQLDHVLRSRMSHFYFTQNGISVIRKSGFPKNDQAYVDR
jgi:hypothetical protein